MEYVLCLLLGIIGSLITTVLGIGGGILFINLFAYLNPSLEASELVLLSLLCIAGSSINSSIRQAKPITRIEVTIALVSVITIFITREILKEVDYNKKVFSLLLLIAIGIISYQNLVKGTQLKSKMPNWIIGILNGITSAFTGLGGGIILNPLLQNQYPSKQKLIHSIVNVLAISNGIFAISTILYSELLQTKDAEVLHINLPYVGLTILGSIAMGTYSKRIANTVKEKNRTQLFLLLILVLTITTIYQLLL